MRKTLTATALGLVLVAGSASAQDVIQDILGGNEYEGAKVLETKAGFWGIKVQVVMPDGTVVTRHYRKNGSIKSEVAEKDGVRESQSFTPEGEKVEVAKARIQNALPSRDDDDDDGGHNECAPDQC